MWSGGLQKNIRGWTFLKKEKRIEIIMKRVSGKIHFPEKCRIKDRNKVHMYHIKRILSDDRTFLFRHRLSIKIRISQV